MVAAPVTIKLFSFYFKKYIQKGAVRKGRLQLGGGVVQCGHFVNKGSSSDADVHNFWCKKSDFSKLMVCQHRQGG